MSLTAAHATSLTWDGNGAVAPNPDGGAGTWDVNTTANWWDSASNVVWPALGGTDDDAIFANTAGTVTLAAGVAANDLTFSSTGYLIQSNSLTLNGTTPTLTTDPGVSATISSVVSGAAGLVKGGSGTLTLSGINNYAGGTTVNAGKLTLDVSARSGGMDVGAFAIGASGTVEIASGTNTNVDNKGFENNSVFTGTGTITKTGIGYFGLFLPVGFKDFAGLIDIQEGVLGNNSGGWGSGAGLMDLNITAGAMLDMRTQSIKIDALSGAGTIEKTYVPALTLTIGNNDGSATFSGVISQTIGGGGGTIALTKNGSGKQTLSGTLTYSGATTINAGTLELQKPSSFASNIALGAANSPTLQLSSPLVTDTWTLSQQISGGSASAKLEKTGLGTVIVNLSGGSSFVGTSGGALTVAAGALYINNSFTTAPAVAVAGGARFGGASTVANVTVGNAGALEGGVGGTGTLTAADVTLGSVVTDTATLKGTLSTTVGYKPLAVTNLTLNGGDNSVTLDATGAGLTSGSYYDLLESANAISAPNASSVAAVFKSNSRSYTPNVDGNKVQLYYDAAASVYWTGAASSAWNSAATNWKLSGNNADTEFLPGDVVFFHDSPTGSTVDISSGDVSPSSTTFDNTTTTAYTLQGSNGIASGALAKSGDGILTISTANSYSGGTTLSAGTLNLEHSSALGTGSVAINGGILNINNAAALSAGSLAIDGGTLNINNASTLGSGSLVINTGALNINNAAALGSRTLAINGGTLDNTSGAAITLTTNNAQTWGGDVVFTGSNDLNLGSGAVSMPASRDVSVTAGTLTVGGAISGSGPLSKSGAGALTLGGINSYTGGTNVDVGKLTLDLSARSGGMQVGTFTIEPSGTLEIAGGTNTGVDNKGFEQNSVFNGTGTITKTGIGYFGLFLNVGFRDFAGLIDIQEGVLGNNSSGWGSGAGLMDLNIAAGAFLDMRTQNIKIDALSGAGTIEKTHTPALTLTLGNNDGSGTFSGVISQTIGGGSGTIAVIKNGSGTQTLTGASTYTGATTVNAGTLALAGDASLASPTITVASGASLDTSGLTIDFTLASGQALSAGRTAGFAEDVKGNLVISDGTLHIAGTGDVAGTLSQTGNLTLGGGTLKFDLAATTTPGDGVNDLLAVTGDLTLVGTSSITIKKLGGTLSAGSYTLISCTGTLSGDAANNLFLDLPSTGRQSYGLSQTANSVVLDVNGLAATLVWTGTDLTNPTFWDLNTTPNWSGIEDGKFADGDNVEFNDTATSATVDIQGFMTPVSVLFNNSIAKPYSVIGTGGIDGATGVIKDGDGVVTLASDNSYTGPTTLNTGTINVDSATALGTGTLVINGGVLDNTSGAPLTLTTNNAQTWNSNVVFSGSNDLNLGSGAVALTASADVSVTAGNLTVAGVISGTGPLTKSGAGALTFTKTNTYSGGTTINAGTLTLDESARSSGISNLGAFDVGALGTLEVRSGSNAGVDSSGLDGNAKFTGTGTLTKTGTGYLGLFFGYSGPDNDGVKNFAGLIDIQQGVLGNNSPAWGAGPGLMDLNIAVGAMFDMRTQNVKIDALSGAGTIEKTYVPNLNLSIGNNDGSATFSGAIDQTVGGGGGNISLTKNGAGTQTFSSANNYGGGTIVTAGTLAVTNTTGSGTGSGAVTVQTTATLAGTGSISGNVSVEAGGFVAPGNAGIGTLTVASAALTGTYQCQLDVASGDQVVVSGALTVNSGAAIVVSTLGSPAAASYIIATYGSLSGGAPTVTGIPSGYVLDTATAGQIKLVQSGGGFSDWADSWLGLTDKTPAGDPDGDGISNVLEYVIGGDPRVSSTSYLPGEAIDGTDLVLSYERSDASEADTTQTGQWSTNLTDWNDLAPVLVNENAADPDSMEIRIPLTNAVGGKLFGRLNVTKP